MVRLYIDDTSDADFAESKPSAEGEFEPFNWTEPEAELMLGDGTIVDAIPDQHGFKLVVTTEKNFDLLIERLSHWAERNGVDIPYTAKKNPLAYA